MDGKLEKVARWVVGPEAYGGVVWILHKWRSSERRLVSAFGRPTNHECRMLKEENIKPFHQRSSTQSSPEACSRQHHVIYPTIPSDRRV